MRDLPGTVPDRDVYVARLFHFPPFYREAVTLEGRLLEIVNSNKNGKARFRVVS